MKLGGAPFAMQLYVEIRPFGLKLVDSSPHPQLSARATQWWIMVDLTQYILLGVRYDADYASGGYE